VCVCVGGVCVCVCLLILRDRFFNEVYLCELLDNDT